jgi:hypothetical protein
MPFGKYKGRGIHNTPKSYLEWLIKQNNMDKILKSYYSEKYNNNFKMVKTDKGLRFFPDTEDDQFNKWNLYGYTSVKNLHRGYFAYLQYQRTLKDIHV